MPAAKGALLMAAALKSNLFNNNSFSNSNNSNEATTLDVVSLEIVDLAGTTWALEVLANSNNNNNIGIADLSLHELRRRVKEACNLETDIFKLLHGVEELIGGRSLVDQGVCSGAVLTMVKLDVWTRFHELTSKKRKPTGRPNEEFYPMGFMPPYHEPWLYGESTGGYRGCYLQATKGDCDYDCPDDMCGTWDHSAHQQCLGMTTEAAALKYVELVTAMFGDQELICKVCAARGWHCFGEEEGCACTGPETRKGRRV
ncbi:unnamed protein product [Polarella glacialis]|uniref:Uncharacterized protein n=1 Tax=Polarella glacialis TaxID=89957 RepID=A0A813EWJ8_POLGL|nr:unnamed protein product [Polarella glacialis]